MLLICLAFDLLDGKLDDTHLGIIGAHRGAVGLHRDFLQLDVAAHLHRDEGVGNQVESLVHGVITHKGKLQVDGTFVQGQGIITVIVGGATLSGVAVKDSRPNQSLAAGGIHHIAADAVLLLCHRRQ